MSTAKQDVTFLLKRLPGNCSVEDIHYHLYVVDKVRRGLEDARINGSLSQEEVQTRLSKWPQSKLVTFAPRLFELSSTQEERAIFAAVIHGSPQSTIARSRR